MMKETTLPPAPSRVLALIDNITGLVWYMSHGQSIEQACKNVARATSERGHLAGMKFLPTPALRPGEVGYAVYDATGLPPAPYGPCQELNTILSAPLLCNLRQVD